MNVLSLFAGIGGLELGLERAGMTVVGQVEIDPYCRRVLAKHWPEVPRHEDVRTAVEWWQAEPRPRVDLVCGGFPCQDISIAGKRIGIAGERSGLWSAMAGIVRALQPRYVLVENVPALLARGLDTVLADLASSGYDADWDCIPAAAVGAPHRRDRIFIVAHSQRLANPESDGWRTRRQGRPAGNGPHGPIFEATRLAHAEGQRRRPLRSGSPGETWADDFAGHAGERRGGDPWATEPDVGRVAHGVPARVDRLRALGNAVVPQVAEHIGRLIVDADQLAAVPP